MPTTVKPEKVVLPIHFEDRSGQEFERLCFAYVLRMKNWDTIDWYGQLGSDSGRDIWATMVNVHGIPEGYCFQCANYRQLVFEKAKADIDKVTSSPNNIPHKFILIAGGKVSATMKQKIADYASQKGIKSTETWSGVEFEERLRHNTPSLLQRFCDGEIFPESAYDLKMFAGETIATSDNEILRLMAQCFDRPAFSTPFKRESSFRDFKKAITDTIEVLNTGFYRLRDGSLIRRIPSRHEVQEQDMKQSLTDIVNSLIELRAQFDEFMLNSDIYPCSCGKPNCPVLIATSRACRIMDLMREKILDSFRAIYPPFDVHLQSF